MIQIKRILCPVDFSAHSRHALHHAVALARWYNAALSVLHVQRLVPPPYAFGDVVVPEAFLPAALSDDDRTQALRAVREFVADDVASGLAVEVLVAEGVSVADAILAQAESLHADLIAMGTHGRTGFNRWVLGSVAERVLRTASPPVLTVPPRAADDGPAAEVTLRRVLCPVDFSACSRQALDFAMSVAQRARARLTVAHVVELLPDLPEMPAAQVEAYRTSRLNEGRRCLSQILSTGPGDGGAVDQAVLTGKPYREILRLAGEEGAGLIVMGVHGRGSVHRLFFGSTTNHVVRQAGCPVLTLRGD